MNIYMNIMKIIFIIRNSELFLKIMYQIMLKCAKV